MTIMVQPMHGEKINVDRRVLRVDESITHSTPLLNHNLKNEDVVWGWKNGRRIDQK